MFNDSEWNTSRSDEQESRYIDFLGKIWDETSDDVDPQLLIFELGIDPSLGHYQLIKEKVGEKC